MIRFLLGQEAQRRGEADLAREHYERLLERAPDNPVLLNNLAWALLEIGDDGALDAARRAHDLQPDNAAIVDTYGWVLHRRGDDGAVAVLERAVELAPGIPELQYHLASALADAGQAERARTLLDDALGAGEFSEREDAEALAARLQGGGR
jgi:Tfp pilus assembly protein PilF